MGQRLGERLAAVDGILADPVAVHHMDAAGSRLRVWSTEEWCCVARCSG